MDCDGQPAPLPAPGTGRRPGEGDPGSARRGEIRNPRATKFPGGKERGHLQGLEQARDPETEETPGRSASSNVLTAASQLWDRALSSQKKKMSERAPRVTG